MIEIIHRRRSTRKFAKRSVSKENVREIICAGLQAPSPKNDQPWRFLVVDQEKKKEEIAEILEKRLLLLEERNFRKGIKRNDISGAHESVRVICEASVIIFVFLNSNIYEIHEDDVNWPLYAKDVECTHIMSIGAAIQNILLAATEKGISSLWMGDVFFAYNDLMHYLGGEGCMMAAIALGYAAEEIVSKTDRQDFETLVKWL